MAEFSVESRERTKSLAAEIRTCMMTNHTPEGEMLSRPMTVLDVDGDGSLWFLADSKSERTVAFDMDESVNLAFSDPDRSRFLSVSGSAAVLRDREKLDSLWRPEASEWFPEGKEDPSLRLIKVVPHSAEFWED